MQTTLTVRLSEKEAQDLQAICDLTGKTRSDVVRDSLRSYRMRAALRASHTQLGPAARDAGWLSEDDILEEVS